MTSSPALARVDISRRLAPAIALVVFATLLFVGPAVSVAAAACPCSLWNGATPANTTADDPDAVEVGVKVIPNVDGKITGLRFYKGGAANAGPHVGHLWSVNGTKLAEVTFQGESPSGWQQANLATPVAVTANATYVASYHAPSGHYSFDSAYFGTPLVSGPLTAPASDSAGGNGVFDYGPAGTFPARNFNATNYWVDVVFTDDLTPPTVTSVSPSDGATAVPVAVQPTATFSEPMDAATITSSTVQLSGPGGPVAATVAYDSATQRVTLTPASALAGVTTYTMTVKGGAGGVADTGGNPLAADRTWSFTTVETTPPVISAVAVTTTTGSATVKWTTNEPSTSRVDYGTDPSLGSSASDATLVTTHSIQINGLTSGQTYLYRVTSADAAGNSATSPAPPAAPASFRLVLTKVPSAVVIEEGRLRSGTYAGLAAQDASYFKVNSTDPLLGLIGSAKSSWYGRMTGVPRTLTGLKVTYAGFNTRSCTQVVLIYRWTTSSWVQLDSRTVGSTEVKIADLTPTGTASNYVSSGGEVRVRVRCTGGSSFDAAGNLMQLNIT